MKRFRQEPGPKLHAEEDVASPVLPLSELDRTMISAVGGKAANLGELIHAGFASSHFQLFFIPFLLSRKDE